jgi:hypothetical protein
MGARENLFPPIGPSNMEFTLEFDLDVFNTSSPGICGLSSPSFMDVELPSNESILEAMIMDLRHFLEMKSLLVGYQWNPCLEPNNGLYL